ncbi:serine protease [Lactococcus ileimucosae]|uniref:serine protease n=1 Tax=Lactococcus ileimucosae TaxID=2941329 RepID=UPI002043A400|nr:serine protease [Lactococcus ileimucosae]
MKFTKKHWIIAGIACLILAGGSAGLVAHHQAQVKAEKTAQEAKRTYDKLLASAKEATEKAETFKAETDVKAAQEAIKKLDKKDQKSLNTRVEKVRKNWDFFHQADKAVSAAEKAKTDQTIKTAQDAVNTLKDAMTKSKKAELQKRLDKVKTELKVKKAKEESKAKAQEAQDQADHSAQPANNTQEAQAEVPATGISPEYGQYSQAQAPATPSYTAPATGGAVAPAQPNPNTGSSSSNHGTSSNGSGGSLTPPAQSFTGWVRNEDGQIIWSQGGFSSLAEAGRAAAQWANTNWEAHSYGAY